MSTVKCRVAAARMFLQLITTPSNFQLLHGISLLLSTKGVLITIDASFSVLAVIGESFDGDRFVLAFNTILYII